MRGPGAIDIEVPPGLNFLLLKTVTLWEQLHLSEDKISQIWQMQLAGF